MNQEQLKFNILDKLKQIEHDICVYVEYSKNFTPKTETSVLKKIEQIKKTINRIS